jgi:hypothetical protein
MLQSQDISRRAKIDRGETERSDSSVGDTSPVANNSLTAEETAKLSTIRLLAVPLAAIVALAVHLLVSKNESPMESRTYSTFLSAFLFVSITAAMMQRRWPKVRAAMSCCYARGKRSPPDFVYCRYHISQAQRESFKA